MAGGRSVGVSERGLRKFGTSGRSDASEHRLRQSGGSERRLRGWQREALARFRERASANARSVLLEATPGAGKTSIALIIAAQHLRAHPGSRLFIVVPTAHLKQQWARSAADIGLDIDFHFVRRSGGLARDYTGAALTYQQVANDAPYFRSLTRGAFIILDEIHHAGDGLSWGNSLRHAFNDSRFVLCLSGTAFRSDRNPIPFVQYDGSGLSVPDYTYPYSRAIVDGVCRPTAFFAYGGEVAWAMDNVVMQADFNDEVDRVTAARALRAALDPESSWLEPMLRDAHEMLLKTRREHPDAGGLIVAADQDHARALAKLIRDVSGRPPAVVLSDDASASRKIRSFAADNSLWLVACNMVSEGVDIPRLRVGVYATTIRTRMYFRQFLGRLVRRTPTPRGVQVAYCFLPADAALRRLAEEVENETRHSIVRDTDDDERDADRRRAGSEEDRKPEWEAIHGENSGVQAVIVSGNQLTLFGGLATPAESELHQAIEQQIHTKIEAAPLSSELKLDLARQIKTLVSRYHKSSGTTHSAIHTALNRAQHVTSQAQCTLPQLEERIRMLERMIASC